MITGASAACSASSTRPPSAWWPSAGCTPSASSPRVSRARGRPRRCARSRRMPSNAQVPTSHSRWSISTAAPMVLRVSSRAPASTIVPMRVRRSSRLGRRRAMRGPGRSARGPSAHTCGASPTCALGSASFTPRRIRSRSRARSCSPCSGRARRPPTGISSPASVRAARSTPSTRPSSSSPASTSRRPSRARSQWRTSRASAHGSSPSCSRRPPPSRCFVAPRSSMSW